MVIRNQNDTSSNIVVMPELCEWDEVIFIVFCSLLDLMRLYMIVKLHISIIQKGIKEYDRLTSQG